MTFFIEIFLSKKKEIEPDSIAWIMATKNTLIQKSYFLNKQPLQYDTKSVFMNLLDDITKHQPFSCVVSQNLEEVKSNLLRQAKEFDAHVHFTLENFFSAENITSSEPVIASNSKSYTNALAKALHTIELFKSSNKKNK